MSISDFFRNWLHHEKPKPALKPVCPRTQTSQEAADKALKDLFSKNNPHRFRK